MIFYNNFTMDKIPYIRSFTKEYVFDETINKYYLHTHVIFISDFFK